MQICPPETRLDDSRRIRPQSIIEAKNKLRLGHDECCNCCCCCGPQPKCLKYVQPERPKSYAPNRYYYKPNVSMEDNTTYRLSYWEGQPTRVSPYHPEDNLIVGEGNISDDTTHKLSYLGNWCFKPEDPITPCERQWLGRGPMQEVTTQKHDYTWKCLPRDRSFKRSDMDNIYCAPDAMSDNTTYRLSYYNSNCLQPVKSYAPVRRYKKSDVPIDGCTTYKLSYWPTKPAVKEKLPWAEKGEYHPPVNRMDDSTTYKLSYWPNCPEPRKPIHNPETENILNANCCFDDNTTYRLSYFGCEADRKREPIRQPENITVSPCPLSHDTTNRLSYLGNWCVKPEMPMIPCEKQWIGRGPMQKVTTQKHDYTWKCGDAIDDKFRPADNLVFSELPLECCTTQRLSFMPINKKSLLPVRSYAPVNKFQRSSVPMEGETTMRLSYQPVEPADKIEKPWAENQSYVPPVVPVDDNTTYNMSYMPPGTLVPLPKCSPPCPPSNTCAGNARCCG